MLPVQARDPCLASLVHSSAVRSAAVSRTRIVGSAGKVVAVYNRETEELLEEFAGSSDVNNVAIWENESGQGLIVAGFEDGTIKAWDAGTLARHIPHPSPKLSAPMLATASLELKAEKQSAHSHRVTSVAFSPDGSTIVSGSGDKTIKVWDAGVCRH